MENLRNELQEERTKSTHLEKIYYEQSQQIYNHVDISSLRSKVVSLEVSETNAKRRLDIIKKKLEQAEGTQQVTLLSWSTEEDVLFSCIIFDIFSSMEAS